MINERSTDGLVKVTNTIPNDNRIQENDAKVFNSRSYGTEYVNF